MTVLLLELLLILLSVPAALSALYLLIMTLGSARLPMPPGSSRRLRFDVVVPAHNEMAVIEATVRNLQGIDWPKDAFRVIVVADNCSDQTASVASATGALVLERQDTVRRGKGYALEFAFARSLSDQWASAIVVIDADAQVSPNLLEAFASRIERGANAVQVHYGVLNPHASWRTRLITIAKGSFHIVRSRARERFGLSCGIRGNGWCVTHELLRAVPYRCFSLTEDLEYGIDIGMAGYRVQYADEAHSNAEMVSGEASARSQRQRWEHGRFQLVRSKTLPLLLAAARRRNAVCFDLGLDLLVLPLSYVVLNVMVLWLVAAVATLTAHLAPGWFWLASACMLSVVAYVLRGWRLSGVGLQGLIDLARAPAFLFWKLLITLRSRKSQAWVRTERETR